ncbi:NUDIX domain-containing protein [Methylobacterium organophilum]|uniref:NUDIX domain-containing protein n=1 Tax=Methylobacterium organophilum TaxID=410 RepID=UPI001F13AA73|nr:NUDIX domain-containing protein [Methylobacterium organophilum]UMY17708.1 NUDIX domain-containing protein [Methylobacterium organophilum]
MAINLNRPILRDLAHGAALLTRGMTLGVRGVAIDAAGRVCLVRHTYTRGWYLPGGGIEPGETAVAAMVREFREETGLGVEPEALSLHGFFLNKAHRGRDHIAVYVAAAFTPPAAPKAPDREIAECGFFPLDALPADLTRGSRARLREIADAVPAAALW